MSIDLHNRRAVVTGAASGFGKAVTHELLRSGATVVATDVDTDGLTRLTDEANTDALRTERLDVGDATAWTALIADAGPFDLAILNAGVATHHIRPEGALPVLGLDTERYRTVMSANIDGVVFGTQAVLEHMTATGFGDIIVTASVAGLVPIAPDPVYGLTKHAVVGFVRSLASALDQHAEPLDIHIDRDLPRFCRHRHLARRRKGQSSGTRRRTSHGRTCCRDDDAGDRRAHEWRPMGRLGRI